MAGAGFRLHRRVSGAGGAPLMGGSTEVVKFCLQSSGPGLNLSPPQFRDFFLSLSFLMCSTGIIIVPNLDSCCER